MVNLTCPTERPKGNHSHKSRHAAHCGTGGLTQFCTTYTEEIDRSYFCSSWSGSCGYISQLAVECQSCTKHSHKESDQ